MATTPRFFQPEIFQDGILSGKISLSETLQHPRIFGDLQLINGKLSSGSASLFNLTDASSRIIFDGNRASLEFLNVATQDVDLALRGEIDFEEINDVLVRITGATPLFDLMARPVDCVNKIEIVPVALPLAPAATELEFRGGLSEPGWSVRLKEQNAIQLFDSSLPESITRIFPLCFETSSEEKPLSLGAVSRAEASSKARSKTLKRQP
jgi:hypothetical protein